MLKLLVRYINDIITWIEDHDQTGAPWTSIGGKHQYGTDLGNKLTNFSEFHAESLLEVDAQCQRWWVLADMTIFNPATTPFKILPPMPLNEESVLGESNAAIFNRFKGAPSIAPIESSPIDISTFEAPPSPALPLKRRQIRYSNSSSFNQQSTMLSLDKDQTAFEFADSWNHGGDSSFPPQDSYGDIDRGLLYNGGVEPEGLAVRHTPVLMAPTPRLTRTDLHHHPTRIYHSVHLLISKMDSASQCLHLLERLLYHGFKNKELSSHFFHQPKIRNFDLLCLLHRLSLPEHLESEDTQNFRRKH